MPTCYKDKRALEENTSNKHGHVHNKASAKRCEYGGQGVQGSNVPTKVCNALWKITVGVPFRYWSPAKSHLAGTAMLNKKKSISMLTTS